MNAPATEDERVERANGLESLLAPCLKCHELDASRSRMAPVRIAEPVMARSIFNHAPHVTETQLRIRATRAVRTSKFATDVNVPGVATVPDLSSSVAGEGDLRDVPRLPSALGGEARGGHPMSGRLLVRYGDGVLQEFPIQAASRDRLERAERCRRRGRRRLAAARDRGDPQQGLLDRGRRRTVGSRSMVNRRTQRALRHLDVHHARRSRARDFLDLVVGAAAAGPAEEACARRRTRLPFPMSRGCSRREDVAAMFTPPPDEMPTQAPKTSSAYRPVIDAANRSASPADAGRHARQSPPSNTVVGTAESRVA